MHRQKIALVLAATIICVSAQNESFDYMLRTNSAPVVITFKEAAQKALANNIALKQSQQKIVIKESGRQLSFSRLLPHLSAKATHDALARDEKARLSLELMVPIFDAKKMLDLRAHNASTTLYHAKYDQDYQALIGEIAELYLGALRAQAQKESAAEEYNLLKRQVANVERLERLQQVRMLLLHKMSTLMEKSDVTSRQKQLEFNKKLGALGLKIGEHDEFLLAPLSIASSYLEQNESELFGLSLQAPDFRVAKMEVKVADFFLWSERLDFLPKLDASFDSGINLPASRMNIKNQFSARAMVNLTLPLFSGGASYAAIKGKMAEKTISELALRQATTEKQLLTESHKRYISDLNDIKETAERGLVAARLAQESALRLFEALEITDSGRDLIDAMGSYAQAKDMLTQCTYNLEAARVKFLLAIGKASELLF